MNLFSAKEEAQVSGQTDRWKGTKGQLRGSDFNLQSIKEDSEGDPRRGSQGAGPAATGESWAAVLTLNLKNYLSWKGLSR